MFNAEKTRAKRKKKNLFAIVLDKSYLSEKEGNSETLIFEKDNPKKYEAFKEKVLSNISGLSKTKEQIQIETLKSLIYFEKRFSDNMSGWIPADGRPIESKVDFLQVYRDARDGKDDNHGMKWSKADW